MRGHLGAGRQEASSSAHQYTIRRRILWIETLFYHFSTDIWNRDRYSERNVWHMITKQDIQAAASYIFRSSFVSEDQARKVTIRAGNNATKNLVKTFRGKLFKKAFERARRGKDISSFERQEKESGFNFLYNPNNGRMRSGHIIIDGIGLFKQIIESGT